MSNYDDEEILKKYICEFIEIYNNVFEKSLEINEIEMIIWIRNNLKTQESINFFENVIIDGYGLRNVTNFDQYIKISRVNYIKRILEDTPFMNSNKIIGIYGMGEHTKQLLKFYETYIGKINSNIIFIDSYKKSLSEKFLGRDVININDINHYKFDEIIISSASYEEEMIKNLTTTSYRNKIITFYGEMRGNLFG